MVKLIFCSICVGLCINRYMNWDLKVPLKKSKTFPHAFCLEHPGVSIKFNASFKKLATVQLKQQTAIRI